MDKNIGMLLDLEMCSGCYACQTACREVNHYSYDEQWMQTVRRDPYFVDGKLRMYHLLAPSLDKCQDCYFAEEKTPLCAKVCSSDALFIGPVEELLKIKAGRQTALYSL
ncbi:MAG: hypothetical protein LBK67_00990 [Coriobacteriales bacterium]|jgi:Fe-S-cluster-containing dehydrogenase component|nr:hypothetical protein [Coriobacteriales bacterium]